MKRLRTLAILTGLAVVIAACGEPIQPPGETHTLTVTVEGDGSGTVTFDSTGGDAVGTSEHAAGTQVTLVATAGDDSTFAGWGDACAGTDATCTVTMDGDKTVTATFESSQVPEEVQLSVQFTGSNAGGRVVQDDLGIDCAYDAGAGTASGDCGPVTASSSSSYTFTATPEPGMEFAGWAGDADAQCADGDASCELTPDKDPFVVVAVFRDPNLGAPVSREVAIDHRDDDGLEWVTAANTGDPVHGPGFTHSRLQYSGLAYVNRYEAEVINGFIFRDLGIPAGATIESAYIQFTSIIRRTNAAHVPSDNSDAISLLITAEASTSPAQILHESDADPLSSRPLVGASVEWTDIPDWTVKGQTGAAQQTVDISAVLQAVVDLDGWDESGDVGIIIKNNDADATVGWRQIATYDEDPSVAPVLHFTYTAP